MTLPYYDLTHNVDSISKKNEPFIEYITLFVRCEKKRKTEKERR
jgi:hypothetical protein